MSTVVQSINRKCKAFLIYETGKDTVFELECEDEMYMLHDDVFATFYSKPQHCIIKQQILLPKEPKSKKDNENEKEYEENEISIVRKQVKPKHTLKLSDRNWNIIVERFCPRRWNHLISYTGRFKVSVFKRRDLGTSYIFWNKYDKAIEWYIFN